MCFATNQLIRTKRGTALQTYFVQSIPGELIRGRAHHWTKAYVAQLMGDSG